MNKEETIQSVTNEFKTLILKAQKRFKKLKSLHDATKREYQTLYKENIELKKRLQQYEAYFKNHQKQKTKREQDLLQQQQKELEGYRCKNKEKSETNILGEIEKLKQLDLLKLLAEKRKTGSSDKNEDEDEEGLEAKKPTKKKKKKKASIMDLINN